MKSSTKSQIEIIGLAFITIIVVILLMYFSLNKPSQSGNRQDAIFVSMSQSFLTSVMEEETACGPDLTAIIQNCFSKNDLCDGACSYAQDFLKDKLVDYFDGKNIPFYLSVEKDNQKKIELFSENVKCTENSEKSGAGIYVIPLFPSSIFVQLEICK